jgi:hypothetical protein
MSKEDNYPMHNDDLTITNENWGTIEIEFHKNNSFETHNIIFNESELLNDMTFFEIQHCEGTTSRITIIYK